MTARALHLHTEEGGADNRALGRHRHIVLRSHCEASRTAEALAALHTDEFGDEEIQGLVIEQ